MRIIYAEHNRMVITTGWYSPTKILSHINMLFFSSEGYVDMYPLDVGAFSLMKELAVIIPFSRFACAPFGAEGRCL